MSRSVPLAGLLRALDNRAAAPTERVLVGIEHEYSVWAGDRWLDARDVFDRSPPDGVRLHPDEPRRFLLPSGITLHADDHVAEVATPPVQVAPGFARMSQAWAELGRAELTAALPGDVEVRGESTHVSVAIASGLSHKVALLYAQTFAPSLMLLLDLPTSPGLLIRPRPGRIEFCGEFIEGAALRTAVAFVVRTVRACSLALESGDFEALPPALRVTLEPARVRFGWYVDRSAFGPDLYTERRNARLVTLDGTKISGGEHMALAIACCESVSELPDDELDPLAQIASGSRPLPSDGTVEVETAGVHANGSVYAGLVHPRRSHDLTYEVVAGTWDFTAFRVRRNGHSAILNIPADRLDRFIRALDIGALDAHMGAVVDGASIEPILSSWTQTTEPGIFSDIEPGKALLPTDIMGMGNGVLQPLVSGPQLLATTISSSALPMATASQVAMAEGGASPVKGTGPFIGTTGWPWWYWACGVVIAALIGIGLVTFTGGDNTAVDVQPSAQPSISAESTPTPSEPSAPAATDITTEIGLAPRNDLRINARFEPGRCGGSPFQSQLVLSDEGDHLALEQLRAGGAGQQSSGYALSDRETIVLFDHGDNYDEMYLLQAGNKSGLLVGVNFYGGEGTLPTVADLPRLDDILTQNGFAQDVIDGGPPRNRFLESSPFPGPPSQYCDLDLTGRY